MLTKSDIEENLQKISATCTKLKFAKPVQATFKHEPFGEKTYTWNALYLNTGNLLDSWVEAGSIDDFSTYSLMQLMVFTQESISDILKAANVIIDI